MAEQLKLVKRDEAANWGAASAVDITTLDLTPLLLAGGYRQTVSTNGDPVEETLSLHETGATDDALATAVQGLDAFLSLPADLAEYKMQQALWLRAQLPGETRARQAMILEAKRPNTAGVTDPFWMPQHKLIDYIAGIKRTGWWENTLTKAYSGTGLSALGGTLTFTGLAGDRPARMARTQFSATNALVEFWAGVQTPRLGETPAYFDPIWNLHLGSDRYGADTAGTSDTSAEDGTKVVVTFATQAALAPRVSVVAANLGSHAAQRGKYLVLLRAKCTSTLAAWVRLDNGFLNPTGVVSDPLNVFNAQWRQRVTGASWKLYTLGTIDFPVNGVTYGAIVQFDYAGLQIQAEKIDGSGNLELDCLVLIPCLDGMMHVTGTVAPGSTTIYEIYQSAAGELSGKVQVYATPVVTPVEDLHPDGINWGLNPTYGGVVAFAAQRSGLSVKGDTLNVALDVYERWITLRGSQGYAP